MLKESVPQQFEAPSNFPYMYLTKKIKDYLKLSYYWQVQGSFAQNYCKRISKRYSFLYLLAQLKPVTIKVEIMKV